MQQEAQSVCSSRKIYKMLAVPRARVALREGKGERSKEYFNEKRNYAESK